MDLISEVYTRGETLLQTVSDPLKSRLENQLAEFEHDWAEFCGAVTECSSNIKEEINRQKKSNDWRELKENVQDITKRLEHFEALLNQPVPPINNMQNVSNMLMKIQVYFIKASLFC